MATFPPSVLQLRISFVLLTCISILSRAYILPLYSALPYLFGGAREVDIDAHYGTERQQGVCNNKDHVAGPHAIDNKSDRCGELSYEQPLRNTLSGSQAPLFVDLRN